MKTVSLELAKQLKEAGYPQEGNWHWIDTINRDWALYFDCPRNELSFQPHDEGLYRLEEVDKVAAPTADEILEKLPAYIKDKNTTYLRCIYIWKDDSGLHRVAYCSSLDLVEARSEKKYQFEKEENLADVLAKVWLYLKEDNLL